MKQRSILCMFCLSLIPILLSAAAESNEERMGKRALLDFKQRLSGPLTSERKGSPREEDAQVIKILRGVSKDKKEGEEGGERVTQAEIKATLKSILRFEALMHDKLQGSSVSGSGNVQRRKRPPSVISSELIIEAPDNSSKNCLLIRNKSSIN